MLIQKQPNNWSCLPTAFAMVCDMPVADLIKRIGHDGSERIFDGPRPEVGFHIQEIIHVLQDEFSITEIVDAYYDVAHGKRHWPIGEKTLNERVYEAMQKYSGVVLVNYHEPCGHALAWDGKLLCDPKRGNTENVSISFKISGFWIVEPRNGICKG